MKSLIENIKYIFLFVFCYVKPDDNVLQNYLRTIQRASCFSVEVKTSYCLYCHMISYKWVKSSDKATWKQACKVSKKKQKNAVVLFYESTAHGLIFNMLALKRSFWINSFFRVYTSQLSDQCCNVIGYHTW